MLLRLLVGLGLLVVFFPRGVWAEQFHAGPVYTDHAGEVSVVVEFETPPAGVLKENFRLVAEGKTISVARNVQPFKDSERELALIICVDVSGSMKGDPLEETRTALATFLSKAQARPQDRIALVSFADEDKVDSPFDASREQLDQAVRDLRVRGKFTRLYQTLSKTLDQFKDKELPKRRRIIVISDGKNEEKNNTDNPESVTAKSKALRIPIDSIGRGKIDKQFTGVLQNLAHSSGGHFELASPGGLSLSEAIEERIYKGLLETRSLVVHFPYQRDPKGQIIQNASVELLQPGNTQAWSEKFAEGIPRPFTKSSTSWWPWILLALALGTFYLLRSARSSPDEVIISQPPPLPNLPPDPKSSYVAPAPPVQPRKATVVGGHYFAVPKLGQPTAVLTAVSGSLEGRQFSIETETYRIGVGSENDLRIVNDDYVSENHAYLIYKSGSLTIFDKGSRNGTFVNQNEVPNSGIVLNLGDRIRVGRSTFEVTRVKN